MKKDVYVYEFKGKKYINLTNRCTNDCVFCVRRSASGVGGFNLWLQNEPTAGDVIAELGSLEGVDEVVFCGFGEPMIRLDVLVEVAKHLKKRNVRVRVNTNGQASAFHGRNTVEDIAGIVDAVSVSLNAADAKRYDRLCRSRFGEAAFLHVLCFARECVKHGIDTTFTVVDVIDEREIRACEKIASETGASLHIRKNVPG